MHDHDQTRVAAPRGADTQMRQERAWSEERQTHAHTPAAFNARDRDQASVASMRGRDEQIGQERAWRDEKQTAAAFTGTATATSRDDTQLNSWDRLRAAREQRGDVDALPSNIARDRFGTADVDLQTATRTSTPHPAHAAASSSHARDAAVPVTRHDARQRRGRMKKNEFGEVRQEGGRGGVG